MANQPIRGLLHLLGLRAISSCQAGGASSQVEQEAATAKAKLSNGEAVETAISSLKDIGFSCFLNLDRSKLTGHPAFICKKTVVEKSWWGHKSFHIVSVFLDADATNKIASSDVLIALGGLRAL